MADKNKSNAGTGFIAIHQARAEEIKEMLPEKEELEKLTEFFRVFADPARIRILYVLSRQELCVCDIAGLLDMGQSAVSHQLRLLKQLRLVQSRREGKTIFYSLSDDHIQSILAQGKEHIDE